MKLETRLGIERRIRNKIVDELLKVTAHTFYLSIVDGEDITVKHSRNKMDLKAALGSVDEEWIRVSIKNPKFDPAKPKGPGNWEFQKFGWIFLVYGNDGYDVINDYTQNLDEHLVEVKRYRAYCVKQEELYG